MQGRYKVYLMLGLIGYSLLQLLVEYLSICLGSESSKVALIRWNQD